MKRIARLILFAAVLMALPSCDIDDELLKRSDPNIFRQLEQDRTNSNKNDNNKTRTDTGHDEESEASAV